VDDLTTTIGNPGAAQPGLLLADVLDRVAPGEVVMVVTLADGAEAVVFRATEHVTAYRERRRTTVAEQVAAGNDALPYATFLTWRGQLHREPPRRPDPERPAAPPSYRSDDWKFGFIASRCESCGTRHLPPQRVCVRCSAVDRMVAEPLADVPATIATYTVDRLAFSLNPPVVVGVIDFDGGGRFQCELTDVDPASVKIGDRVEMTFRRLFTADGVHNYFWKARPLRGAAPEPAHDNEQEA
ncbi:MAG TPA: OB-fold domain-containing protein, partial [Iamia sp.]